MYINIDFVFASHLYTNLYRNVTLPFPEVFVQQKYHNLLLHECQTELYSLGLLRM